MPAYADLYCDIFTSCPAGSTALLYFENDSGGFDNAHAELPSSATSPYVLCCNSTASAITANCGVNFLKLSDESNAHVHDPSYEGAEDYPFNACISTDTNVSCTISTTGCTSEQTCLLSIESEETTNLTNAHVGSCEAFDTDVCCSVNSPPNDVNLYSPENGTEGQLDNTFLWYNATDPDSSNITYHLQIDEEADGFQSPFVDVESMPEGTNLTAYNTSTNPVIGVRYAWRVRAYDGLDYGNWSDNWTFTPTNPQVAGAGGSGGGGGRGGQPRIEFDVQPSSIRTEISEGDEKEYNLKITNTGETKLLLNVDHNLGDYLRITEGTIPLQAGESKEVNVTIIGGKPAIKVGRITLEDEGVGISKIIPVVIEVSSKNAIFDIKMEVLGEGTKVTEGMDLNTLVTIIKMLPDELTDVTLEYSVQDYYGQVLYKEVETMAVGKQKSFTKTIKASDLKPGKYVAGVMLKHPLTFATSSTDFEIVKWELPIEKELTKYIIIGIALLLLLMSIVIIKSLIMGRITYDKYEKEAGKKKKP